MFYLLENNRIIDSNVSYTKALHFWEDKVGHLRVKGRNGKSYQVFKCDKIIKRSENVFDLIEVGDLIKDENGIFEVSEISDGKNDNGRKSAISQPGMFKHWEWEIEAIYKPDEKGNYIKVWERKEENEKNEQR